MTICHVITRMIVGGAQENTLLTCCGLADRGHRVTLITGPSSGPEGRLLDTAEISGVRVIEVDGLVRPLNPPADWFGYRELLQLFRESSFDVVHTHSSKAGVLGRLAAWRARVPVVVHTVHGQAFHPYQSHWRNRLYILLERLAAQHCHHIFAVAQAMVDQCVDAGVAEREKYSVVYSGMDLKPYATAVPDSALRANLGIPPGVPVIGKIARLFDLKGHDVLLKAAARIVPEFPDARFLLVGDGSRRAELEEMASGLGIRANVVFAGLVPPSTIPSYVALMDILAHFSLREGLPRTVVQALAGGVPAVAFDLDGTPEVIENDRTGILCPPEDVDAATDALLKLLRNPQMRRRMGRDGQKRVQQQFDSETMVKQLENAYL
ncbi:MAG: glycosyltransferase family 4 protein, partial [Verrucomicrobiota bacterium]